jgi:hypothetical protein
LFGEQGGQVFSANGDHVRLTVKKFGFVVIRFIDRDTARVLGTGIKTAKDEARA